MQYGWTHFCNTEYDWKKLKIMERLMPSIAPQLQRSCGLVSDWRAHLETCALDWRQLSAAEYLLLHRLPVSLSHLMTSFALHFNSWSWSGSREVRCVRWGGSQNILRRQRKHARGGVKKGFNERIPKEKEGFVNSQCAISPDSLILILLSS